MIVSTRKQTRITNSGITISHRRKNSTYNIKNFECDYFNRDLICYN
jgi:hypothetical protein